MRLDDIPGLVFDRLFGRLIWRVLGIALLALFALVALYHFTVAGTLALQTQYGALSAYLVVAGLYTAAALITLLVLWGTRNGRATQVDQAALAAPKNMQLAMLVEAVLLGYSLARRAPDERTR
jgi:hypothetical protein